MINLFSIKKTKNKILNKKVNFLIKNKEGGQPFADSPGANSQTPCNGGLGVGGLLGDVYPCGGECDPAA